jgi:hypothetical protein
MELDKGLLAVMRAAATRGANERQDYLGRDESARRQDEEKTKAASDKAHLLTRYLLSLGNSALACSCSVLEYGPRVKVKTNITPMPLAATQNDYISIAVSSDGYMKICCGSLHIWTSRMETVLEIMAFCLGQQGMLADPHD